MKKSEDTAKRKRKPAIRMWKRRRRNLMLKEDMKKGENDEPTY